MRHLWLSFLFILCGSPILTAGQVYGALRDASGKGMPGIQIIIISPAKTPYEVKTGADGSYQVFVKETGKCEFQAHYGGKAPATANVFSYADPAKYEFELAGGTLKAK
ncbi:MAG: carboxypeptidase-like regulatory domain-containing protein [Acidobacteriota bacterium]